MFKTMPRVLVLAIPEPEVHIIDVGTSLGNDNQSQVAIAIGASCQNRQAVCSSSKYDVISGRCLGNITPYMRTAIHSKPPPPCGVDKAQPAARNGGALSLPMVPCLGTWAMKCTPESAECKTKAQPVIPVLGLFHFACRWSLAESMPLAV